MRLILPLAALIGFGFSTHYSRDCPCNPAKLWLDIVVAIDTSAGMTEEGVTQVLADISTVFAETTFAQGEGHHSRLGVVTYGEQAETMHKLTDFKSSEEMLEAIWNIKCGNDTASNLKEEGDVDDATQLAHQIKIGGTDIIVVAFDQGGKVNALEGLSKIASPGLLFKSTTENLVGLTQQALCQTNCFCKKQWMQYANGYGNSTVKFGECLRIGGIDANWKSAQRSCQKLAQGGHLATELDISKHNFIAQMFKNDYRHQPPYMYHIGLSFNNAKEDYFWEQPKGKVPLALKDINFKWWNRGFPNTGASDLCVLAAQTSTSFEIGWQNEHCLKVSKRYICQVDSCDTDNYCANVEK